MNKIKLLIIGLSIIFVIIGCDQISKFYARKYLPGKETIKVISNFFVLAYAENTGGFLSLGSGMKKAGRLFIMIVIPLVIIAAALIYIIFSPLITFYNFILISAILGGGISNIIDRIVFEGRVTDFINFGIGTLRTGILNVADMAIFFSMILLMISVFTEKKS